MLPRLYRATVAAFLSLAVGTAMAAPTTYAGALDDPTNAALVGSDPAPSAPSFTDDLAIANNVAVYAFSVATNSSVQFTSLGFAKGGIDPYFTLFAGSGLAGTFLGSNYAQAFSTGGDFDLTFTLAAGDYSFAIGAFANMSFAENLGIGTLADGFVGLGEPFVLGDYTYEIVVTSTATGGGGGTVPEPSTTLLLVASLGGWMFARRRRS